MSSDQLLEKVKQLREITGVGFKDCKNAIDETGIAKANKRMSRTASEGLISIFEKNNKFSMIEINSETDFVAKNSEFIKFTEEISELSTTTSGELNEILECKMKNNKKVKDCLVDLISKIGEKITLRRSIVFENNENICFSYVHSSIKKNIGKLGVLVILRAGKKNDELMNLGKQLTMQVAATSPLAIDKDTLDNKIIEKEKQIISEELKNTGKDNKIIEKIAMGKLNKFINENTLLNQEWIMEPKKKVKFNLKFVLKKNKVEIKKFIRFKVGEGL